MESNNTEEKEKQKYYWESTTIDTNRHGHLVAAARQYMEDGAQGLDLVSKLQEWSVKYANPPFTIDELKVYVQFFLQDKFLKNQRETDPKSQKLYDVLRYDTGLTLFHDQNGVPYARVKIGKTPRNIELGSGDFLHFTRGFFYRKTKKFVGDLQLKDCISLLMMEAIADGEQRDLHHRVVQDTGVIYYDLCREDGLVVKITKDGWVVGDGEMAPFSFRQGLSLPQVVPEKGGDLKDFAQFLNLTTEEEKMLFLCTLPVRLVRNASQAITYIYGPASSGKTTLLKLAKTLLDPSKGGISIPVRKPDDILPLLSHTWLFCNDNISSMSDEMSDFLCTVATGGESSRRKLYTDAGIHTITVKNPAFLTGINVEASRSDLLSRILLFKTNPVVDGQRMSDEEMWTRFEEMKPKLLGAVFTTLSEAMKIKPTLSGKTSFRMTDFALWGAACAEVLGFGAERFEQALKRATKSRAYDAIHSSNAGRILLDYLKENEPFEGTATELLNALKKFRLNSDQYDDYERIANSPNGLSKKLRQLENSLFEVGVRIDFDSRTAEKRTIRITSKVDGTTKAEESF